MPREQKKGDLSTTSTLDSATKGEPLTWTRSQGILITVATQLSPVPPSDAIHWPLRPLAARARVELASLFSSAYGQQGEGRCCVDGSSSPPSRSRISLLQTFTWILLRSTAACFLFFTNNNCVLSVVFSSVYISYGGLLMCLEGDFRHLQNISLGENLYLLMRK